MKNKYLTQEEREIIISDLVSGYEYYLNDSTDKELQKINDSGCFTIGSMKYYENFNKVKK